MSKSNKDLTITIFLIAIVATLIFLNIQSYAPLKIKEPNNVIFNQNTNTLQLNSLTLKQKIAQMIMTWEKYENKEILQNMLIGGIYIGAKKSKQDIIQTINNFQKDATIPFLISTDAEGCINTLENFQTIPSAREMKTKQEAYQTGYETGKLFKEVGLHINFAPVVDLEDTIWNCRNFLGTPEEISEKASAYITGLQQHGILATAKHYPGKTLSIKDPHKFTVHASITNNDLLPFKKAIKNNVAAIMTSHLIVNGSVFSESKPVTVSEKMITQLKNEFTGLIITDDLRMLALKKHYIKSDQMYIDVFKSGNNIILNLDAEPENIYKIITLIETAVKNGEVSETTIDKSVIKILNTKGINVATLQQP